MSSTLTQLVVAVIALILAVSGYGWWYHEVALQSSNAASLSLEIDAKAEAAKRTNIIQAALAKLQSSQGEVQGYFVSENNIVAFLGELEKLGTDIGAKVGIVSVGAPAAKGDQTLFVTLSIDGSFDAVMRTIGAIEHAPYAISVTSVAMNSHGEVKSPSWTASLGISVGSVAAQPK